jgi:hypothetical protein
MCASTLIGLITYMLMINAGPAFSGIGTTVPISAELGTGIAADQFPLTVKMDQGKLFLTEPRVLFIDNKRIGIQVRFQAYDHRPAEGIAVSEMGRAQFSGELGYDPGARQVLLHKPKIDKLEFDRDSQVTQRLLGELQATWAEQVTNPIRSELPQHPYVLPFKENIQDLSYDGKSINLSIFYE